MLGSMSRANSMCLGPVYARGTALVTHSCCKGKRGNARGVGRAGRNRREWKKRMIFKRKAKPTLTPFHLDIGDKLLFELANGDTCELELLWTSARVVERDYLSYGYSADGDISAYEFRCGLRMDDEDVELRRVVGSQESFYDPYEGHGIRLWFDAVVDIFLEEGGFLDEKDWQRGLLCKPDRKARFAVQDASLPICPERVMPWYEGAEQGIKISYCYNGEDCWMGPYGGAHAHCGLDVNMPAGTILYAPISFNDHYFYNRVDAGFTNNRWRGVRRWPDGSEWWLYSNHIIELLIPEHSPVGAGAPYASAAGVWVGAHEHSHFIFRVIEQGGGYFLDPWILFWEMGRSARGDVAGA